jgi:hypothetical protein
MTKAQLLREISSEELTEWIALSALRYEEAQDRKRGIH